MARFDAENPSQLQIPWEELQVDLQWRHLMNAQIMDGVIGKVGTTAWAIYCVVKAHANFKTGKSWPSQARIGELCGVSTDTVGRALKVLEKENLIERVKTKVGQATQFIIVESIPVTNDDGEALAYLRKPYVPARFEQSMSVVRTMAKTGNVSGDPTGATQLVININSPSVVTIHAGGATSDANAVRVPTPHQDTIEGLATPVASPGRERVAQSLQTLASKLRGVDYEPPKGEK